MNKTYTGGCHCGAVRFEADIDLSSGTTRCNCSICARARFWFAAVPAESFRLLAGEAALSEYQFGKRNIHHLFCRHCGIKSFGWAQTPELGKFYAVSLSCLENASADELATAPVQYLDGRNDNWQAAPAQTRHL